MIICVFCKIKIEKYDIPNEGQDLEGKVLMSDVMIAGIFTAIGAAVGFLGTLIQSLISSHNNKNVIKLQAKKEIEIKRYYEKEKLYSDIISFLPQLYLKTDRINREIFLSTDDKIMLNSFKARLTLYSTKELYNEFYAVCEKIFSITADKKPIDIIDGYTAKLLADLKNSI